MGTTRSAEVVLVEAISKRRHRSKQERRAVVEETLRPGASVAVIARRHGVNANQVFHWRKLYRQKPERLRELRQIRRSADAANVEVSRTRRRSSFVWVAALTSPIFQEIHSSVRGFESSEVGSFLTNSALSRELRDVTGG